MLKTVLSNLGGSVLAKTSLLSTEQVLRDQLRTTFILRRKKPLQLHKKGQEPRKLKHRHYLYELVEDKNVVKRQPLSVILTKNVDGLGNAGDTVEVKPMYAYNNLLLPGLAVYASPANVEKYANKVSSEDKHSSSTAPLTVKTLSRMLLSVVMNKENPWTLKPWHVKASFRKCGYIVPEEAITLPKEPITGPNLDNEGKLFYITVKINHQETVNVKCRLHHWSTNITDRLPHVHEFWKLDLKPIYPEHADILNSLPKKIALKDRKLPSA